MDHPTVGVRNLIDVAALLQERGIDLVCLDQPIDTTDAMGRMFFTIIAAVTEFERELIVEAELLNHGCAPRWCPNHCAASSSSRHRA